VYHLEMKGGKIAVDYLNLVTNQYTRILADKCILATPQFVRDRLLANITTVKEIPQASGFKYAPWLVVNLTLTQVPRGKGVPLSWDNVLYGSASLGYVYANHQAVEGFPEKQVITYYQPLPDTSAAARQETYRKTHEQWAEQAITELEKAHPSIRAEIEQVDVWVWGHGMIKPSPGFIWGKERENASKPIQDKIAFAHSDLSGISIFEEAFYQGIKAAKQLVKHHEKAVS
jgi:hypothetical protein